MTQSDYNPQQDSWYSPHHVVDFFEFLRKRHQSEITNHYIFKKAREMFSASIAVFGAYELSPENQYYLQLNRQSSSPDVMTGVRTKLPDGSIQLGMIQLEITEMESHAGTDDIIEFLQHTKLSPRKGYGVKMMIVCFVNRVVPIKRHEIHERLIKIAPRSTIYICGRPIDAPMGTFMIFSPYPGLTKPVIYNINETAKKFSLKSPITLSIGRTDETVPTGKTVIDIYDVMGVDKKKLREKFGPKPNA